MGFGDWMVDLVYEVQVIEDDDTAGRNKARAEGEGFVSRGREWCRRPCVARQDPASHKRQTGRLSVR